MQDVTGSWLQLFDSIQWLCLWHIKSNRSIRFDIQRQVVQSGFILASFIFVRIKISVSQMTGKCKDFSFYTEAERMRNETEKTDDIGS